MLQYIRRWILHFLINREAHRNIRVKKHVDFKDVSSIGVLFLLGVEDEFDQIDRLVKELIALGKDVKMIGFFPDKIIPSFYIQKLKSDIITKKDINLFGFPKGEVVREFIENDFDLLIDLTVDDIFPIDYISGMSRAGLKAGRFRDDMVKVFDIMISKPQDMGFGAYINSMIGYISILNKTKYEKEISGNGGCTGNTLS
ncbi:MAG: hypothetical protein B6D61_07910 [Bacteroidetes bacterium 4484_249]|nr:MAG: hypothetical protein B6D61_07910 [Bacteroidetes bacterium 4484_249]